MTGRDGLVSPVAAAIARARPGATAAAAFATITAAASVIPLFSTLGWLGPTLLSILAMALAGMLARAVSLPLPLQPIFQLLVLLTLLTVMFARPEAAWGFLPGPVALEELQELTRAAMIEADAVLSPTLATPNLEFLSVGGVGLVALAVDTMGVSLRLPGLAGIPLLLMYALPAAVVRGGVPWWLLPVAVTGWLTLLAVDNREEVLSWGRLLAGRPRDPEKTGAGPRAHPRAPRARAWISLSAVAVGLAAILLAVLVPALVPGLREPVWVSPGTGVGGNGDGPGGTVAVDPFVSLRRDLVSNSDRRILSYETDAATPGYLRLVSLDRFDGVTWTASEPSVRIPASEALGFPDAPEVSDVRETTYSIGIEDLDNAALPVPYAATIIRGTEEPLDDRWAWDPLTRTVGGDGVTSLDANYRVTAYDINPSRAELRAAAQRPPEDLLPLLQLPPGVTPQLAELAQEVTADAKTPYARAMALMRWFTREGGFRYSTNVVTPPGADPLDSFLTERVGYCQQFAGTMALMARSVGIPARVSVGFTAGREVEDGVWEVQARNAHAWPELWFPGVGWVWFEPTPRTEAGAGVRAPTYTQPRESEAEEPTDQAGPQTPRVPPEERGLGGTPSTTTSETGLPIVAIAVIAALLAAALVAPVLAVMVRRRRRTSAADPRRRIEGAWAELGDSVRDFGRPWPAAGTPRALAARLVRDAGLTEEEAGTLDRIVWWVENVRYAAPTAGAAAPTGAELRADLGRIRGALRRAATRGMRLRALFAPRSLTGAGRDTAFVAEDGADREPVGV